MHYIVITRGHITYFDGMDEARSFVEDFGGVVFNAWSLRKHGFNFI